MDFIEARKGKREISEKVFSPAKNSLDGTIFRDERGIRDGTGKNPEANIEDRDVKVVAPAKRTIGKRIAISVRTVNHTRNVRNWIRKTDVSDPDNPTNRV